MSDQSCGSRKRFQNLSSISRIFPCKLLAFSPRIASDDLRDSSRRSGRHKCQNLPGNTGWLRVIVGHVVQLSGTAAVVAAAVAAAIAAVAAAAAATAGAAVAAVAAAAAAATATATV